MPHFNSLQLEYLHYLSRVKSSEFALSDDLQDLKEKCCVDCIDQYDDYAVKFAQVRLTKYGEKVLNFYNAIQERKKCTSVKKA